MRLTERQSPTAKSLLAHLPSVNGGDGRGQEAQRFRGRPGLGALRKQSVVGEKGAQTPATQNMLVDLLQRLGHAPHGQHRHPCRPIHAQSAVLTLAALPAGDSCAAVTQWERVGAVVTQWERVGAVMTQWERVGALMTQWEKVGAVMTQWERVDAVVTQWERVGAIMTQWERVDAVVTQWERVS